MDEEQASANAEMRYLTIELMKLAARKKASFLEVSNEFVENVYALEGLVKKKSSRKIHSRSRSVALGEKTGRERPPL